MYDRHYPAGADARGRVPAPRTTPRNVGLFVDFENLQRGFEAGYGSKVEAAALAQRLFSLARGEGRVVLANAYADWTGDPSAAREFHRAQVEPVLSLSKESGEGRAAMELALDVQRSLFEGPDIEIYIIGTGDAFAQPVLRRLREAGVEVVLAAPREAAGRELVHGCDRVRWLDDLQHEWPDEEEPLDSDTYQWSPFVRLLNDLEENLEFVGLNYLIRRVLDRGNCGFSDLRRKQEVINAAQDLGIIEVYQVENKDQSGDPVSACRLVLEHPMVEEILESEEEAPAPSR